MNRHETLRRILDSGVVAVVRLPSGEQLLDVAAATEAIAAASAAMGDRVVIGAGTILDGATARMAINAGARFIVAPTLSRETIEVCHRYGAVVIPGAYTPTEILKAWEWGADLVKVFPAASLGPRYFK